MEKHYSISIYAYCANNPLKFTDPTGIWILVNDGRNTYKYENGKLTYSEYTAKKGSFMEDIVTGLTAYDAFRRR